MNGEAQNEIARKVGVSTTTLSRWVKSGNWDERLNDEKTSSVELANSMMLAAKKMTDIIIQEIEKGDYSILVTYSSGKFEEDLSEIEEELTFDEDVKDKNVVVYCIDKNNTNPYRMYERESMTSDLTAGQIKTLRDEGNIKPVAQFAGTEKIKLKLTPNAVYLVEVKK